MHVEASPRPCCQVAVSAWHIYVVLLVVHIADAVPFRGVNIPPTQGTSGTGAFLPGVYDYEYSPAQVAVVTSKAGFSALRLPINVETANSEKSLLKLKAYVDGVGGHGIICMFDTNVAGESGHGDGRVNNIQEMAAAWRNIHRVFAPYKNKVFYEILNEPFGYGSNVTEYFGVMSAIMQQAGLPVRRCILDGIGYAQDVQALVKVGWRGYLGYHIYPWFLSGNKTRSRYTEKVLNDLRGISYHVFITEFGVNLDQSGIVADKYGVVRYVDQESSTGDWHGEWPTLNETEQQTFERICKDHPANKWCKMRSTIRKPVSQEPAYAWPLWTAAFDQSESVSQKVPETEPDAYLHGLNDALQQLKDQGDEVQGVFHWHGWHNGDSYDFWDAGNAWGAQIVQQIMATVGEAAAPVVNMMAAPVLEMPEEWLACPDACLAHTCTTGNLSNGGKQLTGGRCTHRCSRPYGSKRYCGSGSQYEDTQSVECTFCASPPRCSGLPCWNSTFTADWHKEWPIVDESQNETYERICHEYPDNTWCVAFRRRHADRSAQRTLGLGEPWTFHVIT